MLSVYLCFIHLDFDDPDSGLTSLSGFPPVEERSGPDGAEEDAHDSVTRHSGDDGDDEEDDEENDEECKIF
jgi:hypothetical protein